MPVRSHLVSGIYVPFAPLRNLFELFEERGWIVKQLKKNDLRRDFPDRTAVVHVSVFLKYEEVLCNEIVSFNCYADLVGEEPIIYSRDEMVAKVDLLHMHLNRLGDQLRWTKCVSSMVKHVRSEIPERGKYVPLDVFLNYATKLVNLANFLNYNIGYNFVTYAVDSGFIFLVRLAPISGNLTN